MFGLQFVKLIFINFIFQIWL